MAVLSCTPTACTTLRHLAPSGLSLRGTCLPLAFPSSAFAAVSLTLFPSVQRYAPPRAPRPSTPLHSPSPHAGRVVHVRAVPHPASPCASRSITAAWHAPLAHFTHLAFICAPHYVCLPSAVEPHTAHTYTLHPSSQLSRALSIAPFTCLLPLPPPRSIYSRPPSIPCIRCNEGK